VRTFLFLLIQAAVLLAGDVKSVALPSHVSSHLGEAKQASSRLQHSILLLVPDSAERQKGFLDALETLDGVRLRSEVEVWLADREDPDAMALLEKNALRSLPAMLLLDASGKRVRVFRLGEDCVPAMEAMLSLISDDVDSPKAEERLRTWMGMQNVEKFISFAKAMKENSEIGAEPLYKAWLQDLLASKNPKLQDWAATRLVEACVLEGPQGQNPLERLMAFKTQEFHEQVRQGNRAWSGDDLWNPKTIAESIHPPILSLKRTGLVDPKSKFWPLLRQDFSKEYSASLISLAGYALIAPELQIGDRKWIEVQLKKSCISHQDQVRSVSSAVYWVAAEWLMVYGMPSDWKDLAGLMTNRGWKEALEALRASLEKIPPYWGSSTGVHGLVCGIVNGNDFWKNPDPCLAAWGITRESLVQMGFTSPTIRKRPNRLTYPETAKHLRVSGTVQVGMLLDEHGDIKWMRPKPGFVLPVLGVTALEYTRMMRFDPAQAGGVNHPSTFLLTMPFTLR
jgi:hypothetical protein